MSNAYRISYEIENIDDLIHDLNDESIYLDAFRNTANDIATQTLNQAVDRVKKKFRVYTKKVSKNQTAVSSKKSNYSFFRNGYSINRAGKVGDETIIEAHGYPMKLRHYDQSRGDGAYIQKYKSGKKKKTAKDIRVKVIKTKISNLVSKEDGVAYFRTKSGESGTISYRDGNRVKEKNVITFPSMLRQVDIHRIFDDMWDEKAKTRFIYHLSRRRGKFFI